jgi:hypothetical protein
MVFGISARIVPQAIRPCWGLTIHGVRDRSSHSRTPERQIDIRTIAMIAGRKERCWVLVFPEVPPHSSSNVEVVGRLVEY